MKDFIPFVRSRTDCEILNRDYADVSTLRASLEDIEPIEPGLPGHARRWIDPGVDAFHHYLHKEIPEDFPVYLRQFDRWEDLLRVDLGKPDRAAVRAFVFSALDKCLRCRPEWITVPQLPVIDDASRNKLNRLFAENAHDWQEDRGFEGRFVLPLIFTRRDQLRNRTHWKGRIDVARSCLHLCGTDHLWAVDASLADDSGVQNYKERLGHLVQFHTDLRGDLADVGPLTIIAGPYWAMNLILRARGLVDYAAISLGSLYRYCLSGIPGLPPAGTSHIMIPYLKRRAFVADTLKEWLTDTLEKLDPQGAPYNLTLGLRDHFDLLTNEAVAAHHTAGFYRDWLQRLVNVDAPNRPEFLYEEFSAANKLGSMLSKVPISSTRQQDAGLVAQQLMLACL